MQCRIARNACETSRSIHFIGLILVLGYFLSGCRGGQEPGEEAIKVTLATTPVVYTGLIAVADQKGFFRQAGLDVSIRSDYPAGLQSMQALERGEVQMATGAAFVFSGMMEDDHSLRILAAVGSSSDHEIVARKDRDILRPADLRGKRIGVVLDTVSEYALSMFLDMNAIDPASVTLVDISPPEMPKALSQGEVDAISVWGKFSFLARKGLGDNAVSWPSQYAMDYYWILAARKDLLDSSPEIATRFLKALKQAEQFVLSHEREAKDIIRKRWDLEPDFVTQTWDKNKLRVALDQSLVISLENAVRWRMLTKGRPAEMPNILDKIRKTPLEKIDPKAVTIYK